MAKIKQVFIVEKLNPQQEETIKRIFKTFHNNTCWFRHVGMKKRASETEEQQSYITCNCVGRGHRGHAYLIN